MLFRGRDGVVRVSVGVEVLEEAVVAVHALVVVVVAFEAEVRVLLGGVDLIDEDPVSVVGGWDVDVLFFGGLCVFVRGAGGEREEEGGGEEEVEFVCHGSRALWVVVGCPEGGVLSASGRVVKWLFRGRHFCHGASES